MKPRMILLSAVALASALLLGASQMSGVQSDSPHGCSNATLKGSYGFYRTGFNADGPLAAVGILINDGNGNTTVKQTISRNGVLDRAKFSHQYTVAGDCTFRAFIDGNEFVRGVIVDGGNGYYFLSESGDNTIYGVATKIHPQ